MQRIIDSIIDGSIEYLAPLLLSTALATLLAVLVATLVFVYGATPRKAEDNHWSAFRQVGFGMVIPGAVVSIVTMLGVLIYIAFLPLQGDPAKVMRLERVTNNVGTVPTVSALGITFEPDTPTSTLTYTPTPTYTPIPSATPTYTPIPPATPTYTPIPPATPTYTPTPADTPTSTPLPPQIPRTSSCPQGPAFLTSPVEGQNVKLGETISIRGQIVRDSESLGERYTRYSLYYRTSQPNATSITPDSWNLFPDYDKRPLTENEQLPDPLAQWSPPETGEYWLVVLVVNAGFQDSRESMVNCAVRVVVSE